MMSQNLSSAAVVIGALRVNFGEKLLVSCNYFFSAIFNCSNSSII